MNNPRFQSRFSVAGKPARDNDLKSTKGLLLQRVNKWLVAAQKLFEPVKVTIGIETVHEPRIIRTGELENLREGAQCLLLDFGRQAPRGALRDIEDLSFGVSHGGSQRRCYQNLSKMIGLLEAARHNLVASPYTSGKRGDPEGVQRKRAIRQLYEKYKDHPCYIEKVCADLEKQRRKMLPSWHRILSGSEHSERFEQWEWLRAYQVPRLKRRIQDYISKTARTRRNL